MNNVKALVFSACLLSTPMSSVLHAYEKMPWEKENPTPACPASIANNANLEIEHVSKCVDFYGGKLNNIYQRALINNQKSEGSVVLDITISKDGVVLSCVLASTSTLPKEIAYKIASKFSELKFPSSANGWQGKYTLNFYTG